jgi:hypothetical protein
VVKNVAELLASANPVAFRSVIEGCPNAVLEGMAAGLSVAGTHTPATQKALGPEGFHFLAQWPFCGVKCTWQIGHFASAIRKFLSIRNITEMKNLWKITAFGYVSRVSAGLLNLPDCLLDYRLHEQSVTESFIRSGLLSSSKRTSVVVKYVLAFSHQQSPILVSSMMFSMFASDRFLW